MNEIDFLAAYRAGSHLRDLDLQGVALACASVPGIKANGLNFRAANLREANFCGAVIRMCTFDNANATSSRFDAAHLEDSTAIGADFSRATFRAAHLTETSFSRAVLREAIFDDAEGDGIEFRGADMAGASLKGASFDEADFRGADLRGADLSLGRFHSADFRGALLEGTRFEGADCSGATFDHGEGPLAAKLASEEAPEQRDAAREIFGEFLSALPAAMAGIEPEETMHRVQGLIDRASASAGYSPEQQREFQNYLASLTTGGFDAERYRQILAALASSSDEPPEELKAWLDPLMKAAGKRPL
jgi:uncharacterized protein YjbI with pentapeptide repeats